jgi:iron complex transport system ATP-binding protein
MRLVPSVVEVRVERHYRVELARPILEDVDWRIEPGEHWALVGPNGSGKSTLLAIVAGTLWPSRGVVRVLGHEYGKVDKREIRRRIGVVDSNLVASLPAQEAALDVVASGVRSIIGRLGCFTEGELSQARRALEKVRATDCSPKPYGVLSQGERQRVTIARALVNDPAVLVLDEACGGLDPVARERFLGDLDHLAHAPGGPTQLHVTHHLEEIPPFVTHALVLCEGRVLAPGPAREVLTSETLTTAFGVPSTVTVEDARFHLRLGR